MKTAWHQVKFDLENQARIRASLAQQIIERVDKPIIEFKEKQKKARKDVSPLSPSLSVGSADPFPCACVLTV